MKQGPEFDRIRAFITSVDAPAAADVPPGDDAAVVRAPEGERIVLSTDASVEDIHFRRAWLGWETVGYRAAAAALSDLAGMAARPLGVAVSLMVPPEIDSATLDSLGRGIGRCLRRYETGLLGGDLTHSPGGVAIDVVVLGACRDPVTRGGASPGDELWVTGELGGATAAVQSWNRSLEPDPRARAAFERPPVRIAEALWLEGHASATALIDLSDGLAGDARQIAAASGARLSIDLDAVPLAAPLAEFKSRDKALTLALTGGEDYELLLACRPGRLKALRREFEDRFGVALTRVGQVEAGDGVAWSSRGPTALPEALDGYDHFAGGPESAGDRRS